jgi:hypothetical protein
MDNQQNLEFLQQFWPSQTTSADDVSWEPYAEFLDYVGEKLARKYSSRPTNATVTIDTMFKLVETLYQHWSSTFEQMFSDVERAFPHSDRKTLLRIIQLSSRSAYRLV